MFTITFEDIKTEAAAARADYERARQRYDTSTRALLEARCNELVEVVPSNRPEHNTRLLCMLRRDHEGPHRHETARRPEHWTQKGPPSRTRESQTGR